ncbi:uncharacterized protein LOC134833761 [Culicoides brevitarsis]|uniref:uncharacterized protein LOC134833761 n=1 Tax=Culicoides brevitarsis TaxID=469753 RepID=UPI00307B7548
MQETLLILESNGLLNEIINASIDKLLNPSNLPSKPTKSSKLSKAFDEETIEGLLKKFSVLYKNYCLNYINDDQLLSEFPELSEDSRKLILSAIKANKSKILEAQIILLGDPNEKTMKYFDWDVTQVLSNSSLEGQKTILMNLTTTSTQDEVSHFELTRENVEKLIKLLEENKN